ncbi:YraN family protein [Flavobacteriaceae bacterium KMM 6897]|nr:YraN family protein [Flavobacteriaceae bacterium KMM 6897]MEB8346549.1 YraN family protein [Flavobacteriaceae bacterium KMM 6898]
MGKHNEFGKLGEQMAVDYLKGQGYVIKDRNYRYLKAEIDIVALKENELAIIEVKSRSTNFIEHIAETVTEKKKSLLVMAADHYVVAKDLEVSVRFDIITIHRHKDKFQIEHLEDAFYHF